MGLFGRLFGTEPSESGQRTVQDQPPNVEVLLGRCIVDYYDRTKLSFILILPVIHKVAVKLYVEDFGFNATLKHYEWNLLRLTARYAKISSRALDGPRYLLKTLHA